MDFFFFFIEHQLPGKNMFSSTELYVLATTTNMSNSLKGKQKQTYKQTNGVSRILKGIKTKKARHFLRVYF